MARATSTISVSITGDSRKLQGALKSADKGVGKFGASMKGAAIGIGTALAGIFAVHKVFDFLGDALSEADRLGDAMSNLNRIIGKTDAAKLQTIAGSLVDIGLSSQDVLELSVGFARIAKAAGISPHIIGRYADDVSAVAQALSLVDEKGRGADEWITLISKAAAKPSLKTFGALGLNMKRVNKEATALALKETGKKSAKSLTDAELAAARLKIILKDLKPVVDDVIANPDVELKQKQIGARIEELQGQIGTGLAPIVADILQNIIDISKSEWVADLVAGIEVLQGKHTVPIFEDFKTGLKTVQVAIDVFRTDTLPPLFSDFTTGFDTVNAELSENVAEIQGWIGDIADFATQVGDNVLGVGDSIVSMARTVAGPLGNLRDLLEGIAHLFAGLDSRGNVPGPSVPTRSRNPGGSNFGLSDAEIAAAQRRERERNGIGK